MCNVIYICAMCVCDLYVQGNTYMCSAIHICAIYVRYTCIAHIHRIADLVPAIYVRCTCIAHIHRTLMYCTHTYRTYMYCTAHVCIALHI